MYGVNKLDSAGLGRDSRAYLVTRRFSLFVLFTSYPNTVHFLRQRLKRLFVSTAFATRVAPDIRPFSYPAGRIADIWFHLPDIRLADSGYPVSFAGYPAGLIADIRFHLPDIR